MNEDAYLEKLMEERDREINSRGYRQFKYQPGDPGYGPEFCVADTRVCEGEVGEARRAYGFSNCVSCARFLENLPR
jgi:hypothetical protein